MTHGHTYSYLLISQSALSLLPSVGWEMSIPATRLHMRVSGLPKAVSGKRTNRDSNLRPFISRANALPLRHTESAQYRAVSSRQARLSAGEMV